jgi:multidrug efflux pump subunit AcrA (membrane-fusion protein)
MEKKDKEVRDDLHTERMQDILSKPPGWLSMWGISVVLTVFLMCILISSFIQYPETVNAKLKIVAIFPLQTVAVKDSARIFKVLAQNNQQVVAGQLLAIAEVPAGKFPIISPGAGELKYAAIIHKGERIKPGQVLFNLVPDNEDFYGEIHLTEKVAVKVKQGHVVRVSFPDYSEGNFPILEGRIKTIVDDLSKSDEYVAEVDFSSGVKNSKLGGLILKNGMVADAEITTSPSTLFQRIVKSLTRGIR